MNQDIYASPTAVSMQPVDTRAAFIRKTYAHLAGAIGVFALLEYLLLGIPAVQNFAAAVLSNRICPWLTQHRRSLSNTLP